MENALKADLHVHSKYSRRPSEWVLRKIGCSESYSDPKRVYRIARERGMHLVTITDHNTLAGSLEIAHLADTFISEEITTYFPEDRCKLHVLAYDIDERQHREITLLRENVFDLVRFLNSENILHAVAHPLYAVNDRLTVHHLEKMLLLFKTFELNGTRDGYQNGILKRIVNTLTKEGIARLAEKHDLEPYGTSPWKKNLIAGSDDHSSLTIARTYTAVEGSGNVDEFLRGISEGRAKPRGMESNPRIMAHNLYSIAYQFYKERFHLERFIGKDLILQFADRVLLEDRPGEEGFFVRFLETLRSWTPLRHFMSTSDTIPGLFKMEARDIVLGNPDMCALLKKSGSQGTSRDALWFQFVNEISGNILKRSAKSLLEGLSGADIFNLFHTLGSGGSLYALLAPYFVSYGLFTKDRRFCRRCLARFEKGAGPSHGEDIKVAHFTDTLYEVNGVAKTLLMQARVAEKIGKPLKIITCSDEPEVPGVVHFPAIGTFNMPEYSELKLYYPPLLKMLDYCYGENFTHIHTATPGPIGLAALACARILKLPLYGTYHTALPEYTSQLTGDGDMEDLMWKYIVWFYNQMDVVYVPSLATGEELKSKGIYGDKIQFYPRGIDVNRFHPSKRNGFFRNRYDMKDDELKILYVGRVSREKDLPLLEKAFQQIVRCRPGLRLIVVGSGPYLDAMRSSMKGLPVTFTGYLSGEDLAQAYASSDIFAFPSATDTFGNVVLEAQASGLPVVVTDRGGPHENVLPSDTGFVVPAGDADAFAAALLDLIDHPALRQRMKEKARDSMKDRSFESAFQQLWESYGAFLPRMEVIPDSRQRKQAA